MIFGMELAGSLVSENIPVTSITKQTTAIITGRWTKNDLRFIYVYNPFFRLFFLFVVTFSVPVSFAFSISLSFSKKRVAAPTMALKTNRLTKAEIKTDPGFI
jgi:hypothetical protein